MPAFPAITHVALTVSDLDRSREWYRRLFDSEPVIDEDTDPDKVGEIMAIYLRPEAWGQGIGRKLMAAALGCLTAAGFTEAILWVLESNKRARAFYEACGWTADGVMKQEEMPGFRLSEVRYRRPLP